MALARLQHIPDEIPLAVVDGAELAPLHWKMGYWDMRVAKPKESKHKFELVLLYLLQKIGEKQNTETMLYKLLYFIDFDYYEIFGEQLIGAKYAKSGGNPKPAMFGRMAQQLLRENKIKRVSNGATAADKTRYAAHPAADLSAMTEWEKEHIELEAARFAGWTEKQLADYLHLDMPWIAAKENEALRYELVFYRPDELAVKEYDAL